jgi:hypothetical protein
VSSAPWLENPPASSMKTSQLFPARNFHHIYIYYISIYRVCSNMFPFFVFIFHIFFPSEKVGFPFFDFGGALEKFCLALPEPNCEGVDQSIGRDGRSISLSLVVWCVLGGEPQVHNIVV